MDGIDTRTYIGTRSRKPLIKIELDDLFPMPLPTSVCINVDLGSNARENANRREQVRGGNDRVTNEDVASAENRHKRA